MKKTILAISSTVSISAIATPAKMINPRQILNQNFEENVSSDSESMLHLERPGYPELDIFTNKLLQDLVDLGLISKDDISPLSVRCIGN